MRLTVSGSVWIWPYPDPAWNWPDPDPAGLDRIRMLPGIDRIRILPGIDRIRNRPGINRIRILPGIDRIRISPGIDRIRILLESDHFKMEILPDISRIQIRILTDIYQIQIQPVIDPDLPLQINPDPYQSQWTNQNYSKNSLASGPDIAVLRTANFSSRPHYCREFLRGSHNSVLHLPQIKVLHNKVLQIKVPQKKVLTCWGKSVIWSA